MTVDSRGDLWLMRGQTGGTFRTALAIGNGWGGLTVVGGLDFDGDTKQDLLARDASGQLWLYRGDGAGGWAVGGRSLIGSGWGPFTAIFAAGDFDGRGGHDVLARTANGDLWLYPTNGQGRWHPAKLVGSGWAPFVKIFSAGGFDDTSGPDVLAEMADGRLYLYRGNGMGGWGAISLVDSGWQTMRWIG